MKKLLIMVAALSFVFVLSACGKGDDNGEIDCTVTPNDPSCEQVEDGNPVITGVAEVTLTVGDAFNQLAGVAANDDEDGDLTASIIVTGVVDLTAAGIYTLTYKVTDTAGNETVVTRTVNVNSLEGCPVHHELQGDECVKLPATEIVIMHGAVHEIDPYHENYSGTEQQERQALQEEVEQRLNVDIIYEQYPPSAAWGPSRVTAIIQSSVAGDHLSDIYWSVNTWTQELVENDAIIDVTKYMNTHGQNIDQSFIDIGSYQGGIYGFGAGKLKITEGLYFNADLIDSLGVDSPVELYLNGEWNWSKFEEWATSVQTALGSMDNHYALGGMLSYYAENMVPLNGGSLLNANTGRVSFAQNPALETYTYLEELYSKGLFELNPQYDAGSPEWKAGKVAIHPGSLWFVTADNRWGQLQFELGFVPYPVADDFDGEYASPVASEAVYSIASGMSPEKEELVFQVWNEIQLWKTDQEEAEDFELILITKFDDELYIEAYLEVYDKVYLDLINAIGISPYSENGWTSNINRAIREGNSRTTVDQIKPIYETALDDYLGN